MGMTAQEAKDYIDDLARRRGVSAEQSDIDRLQQTNDDDLAGLKSAYETQYEQRAESTDHRAYDSQGEGGRGENPYYANDEYTHPSEEPGYGTEHGTYYGTGPRPAGQRALGGGSGRAGGAASAYGAYLGSGQPQDPMLARLVQQLEADRARQEQERAQMREMVMAQLGDATRPVSADDPGIKPLIDAQKLSLQRGSQRQRSAAVEQAGARSLGDSGALNTRINQIEQGRGESEAAMIAQVLNNELGQKRNQVLTLLDLATRSGDAASARTLQGQLATLDQQMTQNRFNADLGYRYDDLDFRREGLDKGLAFQREGLAHSRYAFDNDLAYRLAQLQLLGNQGSMGFLGGLI